MPLSSYSRKLPDDRRRTVTLIAGLVTNTGIVFASDSEESGGYRKASADKILSHHNPSGSSIVVSGSGHGHLIDYTAQRILKEATPFADLSKVLSQIEGVLKDVFQDHVRLQAVRDIRQADFELLIGVKASSDTKAHLFSTSGISIIEKTNYQVCGSGSLVDYVLSQMYHDPMTTEDAVCACLHLLTIAKEYVDGVGVDSHIKILNNRDGGIIEKPDWEVTAEEDLTKRFARISADVLFATLRTQSGSDADFEKSLHKFSQEAKDLRERKKKSDEIIENLMKEWRERLEKNKKEAAEAAAKKAAAKAELSEITSPESTAPEGVKPN